MVAQPSAVQSLSSVSVGETRRVDAGFLQFRTPRLRYTDDCPRIEPSVHPVLRPSEILLSIAMSNNKAEGRREDALAKQRNQMREEFERQKQSLINETEKARPSSNRFVGQNDSMEDTLKKSTVGLVKLEEFQQRRKELEEAKAREAARTSELKYVVLPLS